MAETIKTEGLGESIDAAALAVEKSLGLKSEDDAIKYTPAETGETPVKEEETPDDNKVVKEESDLSELEVSQARELFKALKDPAKAPGIIEYIAKQAGFERRIEQVKTEKQADAVKDDLLETLKSELGDEFDFLTPRLGKALDKILTKKLEEHGKDVRESIDRIEKEKVAVQVSSTYSELAKHHFGTDEIPQDIQTEMSSLMDKYKPGVNMSVKEYLTDMLNGAAARLGVDLKNAKSTQANKDRINKNRTDAPSRLASDRGAITETRVVGMPSNKTLDLAESIKQAEAEVAAKFAKG